MKVYETYLPLGVLKQLAGRSQARSCLWMTPTISHALRTTIEAWEAIHVERSSCQASPPINPPLLCSSDLLFYVLLEALIDVRHEINVQFAVVQCPTISGVAWWPKEILCPWPLWFALCADSVRSKPTKLWCILPWINSE